MKTKSRFTSRDQILARLEAADAEAEECRMIAYACGTQKTTLVRAGMTNLAEGYAELEKEYTHKYQNQCNRKKHFGRKLAEFDTIPLALPGMDESVERRVS